MCALLQCLQLLDGYGPVWGALVCVYVGFWDRDYVIHLPCVRYYHMFLLRAVLNILVRNVF